VSDKIYAIPMTIAGKEIRCCAFCGEQMETITVEWSQMGGSEILYKCKHIECNRAGNRGEK